MQSVWICAFLSSIQIKSTCLERWRSRRVTERSLNTKGLNLYEWEHVTELLSKSQMKYHPYSTCLFLRPQAGFFFLVFVLFCFCHSSPIFEMSQSVMESSAIKCFEVLRWKVHSSGTQMQGNSNRADVHFHASMNYKWGAVRALPHSSSGSALCSCKPAVYE